MKNKARHTKGFSLSELLITAAIIAVLVSCSIPIFASKLEKSRRAVDIVNARKIRSAITNILNDGTLTFLKEDMGYAISVTSGGINMGLINGKWENVLIKGKKALLNSPVLTNHPICHTIRNTYFVGIRDTYVFLSLTQGILQPDNFYG